MHKLLRDSKEVKMIHTEHKENGTVCHISGNSQVILAELLMTISQVLKAFNKQGVADHTRHCRKRYNCAEHHCPAQRC